MRNLRIKWDVFTRMLTITSTINIDSLASHKTLLRWVWRDFFAFYVGQSSLFVFNPFVCRIGRAGEFPDWFVSRFLQDNKYISIDQSEGCILDFTVSKQIPRYMQIHYLNVSRFFFSKLKAIFCRPWMWRHSDVLWRRFWRRKRRYRRWRMRRWWRWRWPDHHTSSSGMKETLKEVFQRNLIKSNFVKNILSLARMEASLHMCKLKSRQQRMYRRAGALV